MENRRVAGLKAKRVSARPTVEVIYSGVVASLPTIPFNRYKDAAASQSIVYNVVKLDHGWRIEASLPRSISPEDRRTVVNWFQEYRSRLRRSHPLWVANFRTSVRGYSLEIKPVRDPRDLMEKGQNLKGIWTDEIANRA